LVLLNTYIAFQRAKHSETKSKKKKKFFFSLGETNFARAKKIIAWAKVVQRAKSIFAWAKIISPGREYLIAWAKDFSPRRKHSREHTCSRGFLAWATVPWLEWTTFSPGRVIFRLGENSSESILTTRNHSRLGELCRKFNRIHYTRVTMHASND